MTKDGGAVHSSAACRGSPQASHKGAPGKRRYIQTCLNGFNRQSAVDVALVAQNQQRDALERRLWGDQRTTQERVRGDGTLAISSCSSAFDASICSWLDASTT